MCLNCGGAGFLHVPFPHQCPYCVPIAPPAPRAPVGSEAEAAFARAHREQETARRQLLRASDAEEIFAVLLGKRESLSGGMYRWADEDARGLCAAWSKLVEAGYVEEPSHNLVPVRVVRVFGERSTFLRRAGQAAPAWRARFRSVEAWLDTQGGLWTENYDKEPPVPGAIPLNHGGIRHLAIAAGEPIRLTSRPTTRRRCLVSGAFVDEYSNIGHPNELLNRLASNSAR